jgi:hypothetical protein
LPIWRKTMKPTAADHGAIDRTPLLAVRLACR